MKTSRLVAVLGVAVLVAAGAGRAQAQTLGQLDKDVTALAQKVSKSVVTVTGEMKVMLKEDLIPGWPMANAPARMTASGVVYDKDGRVVTVASAVPPGRHYTVTLADGRIVPAEVVGRDSASNLAVLKVTGDNLALTPAVWGKSSDVKAGNVVIAVGSSFGMGPSVTLGIVSAVGRSVAGHADLIQITAPINPGDSGGALANSSGEVIGIVTATLGRSPSSEWLEDILRGFRSSVPGLPGGPERMRERRMEPPASQPRRAPGLSEEEEEGALGGAMSPFFESGPMRVGSQELNFALPADEVRLIADQLIKNGKVVRGWLGVMIEARTDNLPGVVVAEVAKDSPADKAGVKVGDRLLAVNGMKVNSFPQLFRTVAHHLPGEVLNLEVMRGAEKQTLKATLTERPAQAEERGETEVQPARPRRPMMPGMPPASQPTRPMIGIQMQPLTPRIAEYFGVKDGRGVLVTGVLPGSPADKAGIRMDDVVVSVDGAAVANEDELRAAVARNAGKTITLGLVRNRANTTVHVTVSGSGGETSSLNKQVEDLQQAIKDAQKALEEAGASASRRVRDDLTQTIKRLQDELDSLRKSIAPPER